MTKREAITKRSPRAGAERGGGVPAPRRARGALSLSKSASDGAWRGAGAFARLRRPSTKLEERSLGGPAIVMKIGGELVETPQSIDRLAREIVFAAGVAPLVVVHGGGRTIDAELARRGVAKRAVDGLRVTDEATLDVVVSVLAGLTNTRLVAAIGAAGGRAVGLTGADAGIGLCEQAPPHRSATGALVDLGLVGRPIDTTPPALVGDLCAKGYIPVVASIGISADGRLFNVNADTWAAHLAATLRSRQLLIVGATAGVLDEAGATLASVDVDSIDDLVAAGSVSAGMIAKLDACRQAWLGGVRDIRIVDGRGPLGFEHAPATRITGSGFVPRQPAWETGTTS